MEHHLTTYLSADTIISSLGFSTPENLDAIRQYRSGIALQEGKRIADQPILAALLDDERLSKYALHYQITEYTRLEQLFILSISQILKQSGVSLQEKDCGLMLSTTKGNISLLSGHTDSVDEKVFLWNMAQRVGGYFHAANRVRVVSNACISGLSALIVAKRLLESRVYKSVVVAGGDVLSHFITSGFLSFKSVSKANCIPYDARRDGLNLGEACGAVLLTTEEMPGSIIMSGGAISNDANHISGPSRTGDGLALAIRNALYEAGTEPGDISFTNTHGTATLYNDEMEAKAIHLAHLQDVPVNSLKPYFGHTLGASGIIETIISLHELKNELLFGTRGYEEPGVSIPLHVSATHRALQMKSCLKTASGFGGCNAAIVLTLPAYRRNPAVSSPITIHTSATLSIEDSRITLNGKEIFHSIHEDFASFIRDAFKSLKEENMKFYKMDNLCKLGYIAATYLLKNRCCEPEEIGIILSNAASSLHTDIKHQNIIDQAGDDKASPTIFVYTLPNVVLGEICIRHKIQGENTFFIDQCFQTGEIEEYACIAMTRQKLKSCITGWCELTGSGYKAAFKLMEKQ